MTTPTGGLYDTSSFLHDTRKEMRKGLLNYENPLITQPFILSDRSDENKLWEGMFTDGTTKVRSGPDYNRFNTTLILPNNLPSHPDSYIAVFVGCYATEVEADRASKGLDMVLMNLGRGHGQEVINRDVASFQNLWKEGERTSTQLAMSLRPCGHCNKTFSLKKCSGCKFQFYCCVEHQRTAWSEHKPVCKAARQQRKDVSKIVKQAKKQMDKTKKANMKLQQVSGTDLDPSKQPLATPEETSEASKMYGFLFDLHGNQLDDLSKVNLFQIIDTQPKLWNALLSTQTNFLEKIAEWIMKSDAVPKIKKWKPPKNHPQHHPNIAEWFFNYLLRGMTTGNTMSFSGCNATRAYQFFVETNNGWNSVVASLLGLLHKLYSKKVQPQYRGIYDGSVRSILRFLTGGVLVNAVVGSGIVKKQLSKSSQLMMKEMMELVGDPKNAKYDPGSAIEGLVNQFVALIHVWTEKLKIKEDFIDTININDQAYVMYKVMAYRMSVVMVEKGRNVIPEEMQVLNATMNDEMGRMMLEMNGRRGGGNRKKKGKKGKRR